MLLGGSSVADYRRLALLPFDSGELTAVLKSSGIRIWSASVSTTRKGSARSNINSVTSDPVVFNDVIYTANQGGRLVALNANDGIRKWTDKDGSYSPIWVVDNSVFIVTDIAQLKRLDINSGELIWSVDLPKYPNKKKRNKSYAHYGPLLAGGKLWVASSDGFLRAFEPVSGNIFNKIKLPHGAASHASVVNGVYYILNQQGQLLAFK
jgi:outer membrane protein assembly factor BamB